MNFKHVFNHKDQEGFPMPRNERHLLVDDEKISKNLILNIPFGHSEVINYTLDGVSIHSVTTKIQTSFLTQLPERKETVQGFHHEANGDLKTVPEFNLLDVMATFISA
jgi:hypothetical protein